MHRRFCSAAVRCAALVAASVATSGCMARRLNDVTASERWPLAQSPEVSIAVQVDITTPGANTGTPGGNDNTIAYWTGARPLKLFCNDLGTQIVGTYRDSGLFTAVTEAAARKPAGTSDFIAVVELSMVEKVFWGRNLALISTFTLGIIPVKSDHGYFEMKTTLKRPSGAIVDVTTLTERHETWGHIFLIFHEFANSKERNQGLMREIVEDLTRATLQKLEPSIKADVSGKGSFF